MPIDYSKWDKIELSDDSDIEVHPNVDKKSFIKWKQRDIHEKRIQRENDIKSLKVQKEMYIQLNKRVDSMLINLPQDQFTNETLRNEYLNSKFDKNEKCELDGTSNDTPTYNEMVEDLFTQMVGDLEKENKNPNDYELLKSKIKEHRAKIETVLQQIDPKLDELLKEKAHHITSEDIHDGWNSSFVNKDKENAAPAVSTDAASASASASDKKDTTTTNTKKESVTTIETLNTSTSKENKPSKPLDQLDELEVLPETLEFAKIDPTNLLDSVKFLEKHLYIISEQQKDSLMMKSFDYILDNDIKMGKSVVHQSLILQYLNDLINAAGHKPTIAQKEQIVRLFIGKLLDPNHPAAQAFKQDFEKTYKHIVSRCEHIKSEQAANGTGEDDGEYEGVEQIQLRSMDPNSEIVINLPDENSEEYKFFKEIPTNMQNAIKTQSLDEINKVFATMPVEEAEHILELFDKCGVIQIQAVLENEDQFNQLKNQYHEGNDKFEEIDEELEENTHSSTGIKDLNINEDEDVKFTPTADLVD
ncbi:unnamed protein product [[Candida] boidinii]|nr:protein binding protein [[Candida] boidinii]GME93508.1 unnamed protein product [[Candida] boidinii]